MGGEIRPLHFLQTYDVHHYKKQKWQNYEWVLKGGDVKVL